LAPFAAAQNFTPPPVGAYASADGVNWNPWTAGSGLGAVSFIPPPAGMYCEVNPPTGPWTPCNPGAGVQGANFVFVGDSLTGGLQSSTGNVPGHPQVTPSTGYAAITTGSAANNSPTLTIASATNVQVGQFVTCVGTQPGSMVSGLSGTTVTLSLNTWQAIPSGTTCSFNNADYPAQLMTLPNFKSHGTGYNLGVAGWTIQLNLNDYFGSVHPLSPAVTGKPGYLFVMMGVNDINVSNSSAATIESLLTQYYQFAIQDGWVLIPETILPAPFTAAQETVWQQVNTWIRSQSSVWNRLIDTALFLPNNYDTTFYYSGDTEHLINPGYGMLAHAISATLATYEGNYSTPQFFFPASATGIQTPYTITGPGLQSGCAQYPCNVAKISLTGQTAAITTTNLVASAPAGTYRISAMIWVQAIGTAGTAQVVFTCPNGTSSPGLGPGAVGLTATNQSNAITTTHIAAGSNLTYAVNFSGVTGTPQYGLDVVVDRLQ
jgi:hypothetical protein